MSAKTLPNSAVDAMSWTWSDFAPHYEELKAVELTESSVEGWLTNWSKVSSYLSEIYSRLHVATTLNTADKESQEQLQTFATEVVEPWTAEEDKLNRKLIESGLKVDGMEVPMMQMQASVELFREENLPLQSKLVALSNEYDEICGKRSVNWEGEEITLPQAHQILEDPDRSKREAVWRQLFGRILEDRAELNDLWTKMFDIRCDIAKNAGCDSYTEYTWKDFNRFDYSPDDVQSFRDAIEEHAVPALAKMEEHRRSALGVDKLMPWDIDVDIYGDSPLNPFNNEEELMSKSKAIFQELDPVLADRFQDMQDNKLIDLFSRKNKANGGYCTSFAVERRPFVFMNAVGTHSDLQTLIHEAGHCFHVYDSVDLPYKAQLEVGAEFAEVASMGMEMLAQKHLDKFYDPASSARAQISQLERMIKFWPYMSVVDAFQTWAYNNPADGRDPSACDQKWSELWSRFMPVVAYSDFPGIQATGWHRKLHIFQIPFYYVEYGLAQVGALQIWQNSLEDQDEAVQKYRSALSLGVTRNLPGLFSAAGGRFAFDGSTIKSLVGTMNAKIDELRTQL